MDGKICRICLQDKNQLHQIFEKNKDSLLSPYEKLQQLKLIEISVTSLSSICSLCLVELDNCVKFFQKCEQSNKILSSMYPTQDQNILISSGNQIAYLDDQSDNKFPGDSDIIKDCEELSDPEEIVQDDLSSEPCIKCDVECNCTCKASTEYTCEICQKVFTKKFNYHIHIKRHLGIREFPCPTCGTAQVSSWLAKRHCETGPNYPCPAPNCFKSYTSAHNLTVHIRNHTGEKPYKCHCGQGFTSRSSLNSHARTHTGVKPYMCSICGARFATNKLVAHLRTHAQKPRDPTRPNYTKITKVDQNGFICTYCSTRYSHKQSLNRHVRKRHADYLAETDEANDEILDINIINSESLV